MRPLHYGIRFGEGGEAGGEGEGGETGGGGGGEGTVKVSRQRYIYIYVCRTPWNVLPWQCNNITALLIVAVF